MFEVPSETNKDRTYIVRLFTDDSYRCECPAFVFNNFKDCKHIKLLIKSLTIKEIKTGS